MPSLKKTNVSRKLQKLKPLLRKPRKINEMVLTSILIMALLNATLVKFVVVKSESP